MDSRDLQLNALLGITQAINNNLPEEDLLRIYKFTLLGDFKVKRLALFVKKDDSWSNQVSFGTEKNLTARNLGRKFDHLISEQVIKDQAPFEEFHWVVPILHKKQLLALLFIENVPDTTFVKTLTNIIIVAVENKKLARERMKQEAYQREMQIARKVQNFLFPKVLPNSNRLRVQAIYLPHQNVGGDYYDYIKISEDKFLICIADVSGKGVPAALLMSNFQATLRVLVRKTTSIEEIVAELNRATYRSGNGENFITFFVAIYDADQKKFEFVNCGHNPPYIIRNEELRRLETGTTILGMFEPLPFMESEIIEDLEGFVFFGYTDGLTETFNEEGEPFGEERLEAFITKIPDLSYLHNNLLQELDAYRGDRPYDDDITVLSCQVLGGS